MADKKIAILATDGFEKSELLDPQSRFAAAGATVHVVAPEAGEIRSWDKTDWGERVPVDRTLEQVSASDYDALVLPGGQINPDILRTKPRAVELVRAFARQDKPIGAICHGPWMLVEADLVRGRQATSYPSIRTDMTNAGASWSDREVIVDGTLVTSRKPEDLPAFCDALAELVAGTKLSAAAE
jgi:protease I